MLQLAHSSRENRTGGFNLLGDDLRPRPGHVEAHNRLGIGLLRLRIAPGKTLYEEYHPYGTSAYRAFAGEVSAKRYRYTGKERDEETSLYYHGARYYAPWLGRWTQADPAGTVDGTNLYAYVRGSPINLHDPSGLRDETGLPISLDFDEQPAAAQPSSQASRSPTPAAPAAPGKELAPFEGGTPAEGVKIEDIGEGGPGPQAPPPATPAPSSPAARQGRVFFQTVEQTDPDIKRYELAEQIRTIELTGNPYLDELKGTGASFYNLGVGVLNTAAFVGAYPAVLARKAGMSDIDVAAIEGYLSLGSATMPGAGLTLSQGFQGAKIAVLAKLGGFKKGGEAIRQIAQVAMAGLGIPPSASGASSTNQILTFGENFVSKLRQHSQHMREAARELGVVLPTGPTKPATQLAMQHFISKVITEGTTRVGPWGGEANALWSRLGNAIVVRRPNGQFWTFFNAKYGQAALRFPGGL